MLTLENHDDYFREELVLTIALLIRVFSKLVKAR